MLLVFPLEVGTVESRCVVACFPMSSWFSQRGEQKSVVLVVSPLISLIKDQVRAIEEKNMTMVYSGDEDEHSENLPFQGRTSCS